MILETERLILRPWEESDAEILFEYAKDPAVGPAAGWPAHKSVEESLHVIRNVLNGPECYAVCMKTDGRPIGAAELMLQSSHTDAENECELGFWIGKPFWGRGLIPEAARELLRRAFEALGMRKVWCAYYDGNEKSRRAQEKLGFRYEKTTEDENVPQLGEKRRHHANLLTREAWEARRARQSSSQQRS